jgi:hypothetical protein
MHTVRPYRQRGLVRLGLRKRAVAIADSTACYQDRLIVSEDEKYSPDQP